ncbi:MAG: type II toxin-antitoxin system VapC family toxin [Thaumarchaeota archaeon]|nr:type II toxin-antitoxin system VapC family toxin [Nitrososphaerota archaeon]
MLYLDANFFIFALLDNTGKGQRAREIFRGIAGGREEAVTSPLTLDELMWVLIRGDRRQLFRTAIEGVYATPSLEILTVSSIIPMTALDMMEEYDLKPRDAFHAAIMKENRITNIVTDDADFDRVKWIDRITF